MAIRRFGQDLYYTAANGELVIASVYDALYAQLTEVLTQQMVAARSNIQAQSKYMTDLGTYQTNLSAGRGAGLTPPVKPLYTIVADAPDADGNPVITQVPWPEKLPDPVVPKTYPSNANQG